MKTTATTIKTKPKVSRQDMRDVVIRIGVNYQSAQPSWGYQAKDCRPRSTLELLSELT